MFLEKSILKMYFFKNHFFFERVILKTYFWGYQVWPNYIWERAVNKGMGWIKKLNPWATREV